jgi:hypothetical protein
MSSAKHQGKGGTPLQLRVSSNSYIQDASYSMNASHRENFGLIASQESEKKKNKGKRKKKSIARSKSDTIIVVATTPSEVPVVSSSQPTATQPVEVESSSEDFCVLSSEGSEDYQIARAKKRRGK